MYGGAAQLQSASRAVRESLNANFGIIPNTAKHGLGDASVGGRLTDVGQLQDILADRHAVLRCQLHRAELPPNVRQRRTASDTREVDGSSRRHVAALRQNCEMRRYATNSDVEVGAVVGDSHAVLGHALVPAFVRVLNARYL